MTVLAVYNEDGTATGIVHKEFSQIARILNELGIQFEQWDTPAALSTDADTDEVLAAYHESIEQLRKRYPIQSVDVVALRPDNPKKEEFRQKFLAEHTHSDFEIRFFVDGSGLFYLHINNQVYLLLCEKGDLVSVPANTTHWFDMGAEPNFKCIRLFTTKNGWVGDFTGNDIARCHLDMDQFVTSIQ